MSMAAAGRCDKARALGIARDGRCPPMALAPRLGVYLLSAGPGPDTNSTEGRPSVLKSPARGKEASRASRGRPLEAPRQKVAKRLLIGRAGIIHFKERSPPEDHSPMDEASEG